MNLPTFIEKTDREFDERFPCGNIKARENLRERTGLEISKKGCGCLNCKLKSFLHTRLRALLEEVVGEIEGMNNFSQAKVDGDEKWNRAMEQAEAKVRALASHWREEIKKMV